MCTSKHAAANRGDLLWEAMPGASDAQVCAHCEQVVPRLHEFVDDGRASLVCRLCFIHLKGIEPHRARKAQSPKRA
jgi:hypothetical protein